MMTPARKRRCLATVLLACTIALGATIRASADESSAYARPQLPSVGGKAKANLPVVQLTSEPIEADGLEFRIISSTMWPMPAQGGKNPPEIPSGESPLQIRLQITNHRKEEVRILKIAGNPVLRSTDGKELQGHCLGANGSFAPKQTTLGAGRTVTVGLRSRLCTFRTGSSLRLEWLDEFGGYFEMEGLKPGKYLLRLQYDTQSEALASSWVQQSGVWLGDVRTAEVPVEIVDLKASPPAVFNGVEAYSQPDGTWRFEKAKDHGWKDPVEAAALADRIWQVPTPGKQTQVGLGFRMAAVEQWAVRIIPSLAKVCIESADGVEMPARKTAVKVAAIRPQSLDLFGRVTQSIATPAVLFRDGKLLTLAWADGAGHIWQVENLKPGRYSVRLLIRTGMGDYPDRISYWVGRIWTEAVTVEIKE